MFVLSHYKEIIVSNTGQHAGGEEANTCIQWLYALNVQIILKKIETFRSIHLRNKLNIIWENDKNLFGSLIHEQNCSVDSFIVEGLSQEMSRLNTIFNLVCLSLLIEQFSW